MFITINERVGTCYFEFQFCKRKMPVNRKNKLKTSFMSYWKEDSLLLEKNNFEEFYRLYKEILDCALLPNGSTGFYEFGINYYNKEQTEKILSVLKNNINKKYERLIPWLEEATKNYNGFYILGI